MVFVFYMILSLLSSLHDMIDSKLLILSPREKNHHASATVEIGVTTLFLGVLILLVIPYAIRPYSAIRMEHASASVIEVADAMIASKTTADLDDSEINGLVWSYTSVLGDPDANRYGLRIVLFGRNMVDDAEIFSDRTFGGLSVSLPISMVGNDLRINGVDRTIEPGFQGLVLLSSFMGPVGSPHRDQFIMITKPVIPPPGP